ncbi:MAG: lysine exporter LysO family protein [Bacteroidales bacterium]|nr:lysine exporter LysO family protein [Candidatus Cacconaster merdequi]
MKDSLIIILCFLVGIILAIAGLLPDWLEPSRYTTWMLYLLLFCIGVGLGMDKEAFSSFKGRRPRYLLLPVATILGTFAGCLLAFLVLHLLLSETVSLKDTLAIGSGFGYYSLSSVMLSESRGAEIATIALAANLIREILTLLCAPLIARFFGPYAVVSCGGAASMDTTMAVAVRAGGSKIAPVALYHGFLLTVLVPFLITLIVGI